MNSNPWPLRNVTLKVLDLPAQINFYEDFGFHVLEKWESQARLSAGNGFFLTLNALENGRPRPPRTAGLFHFAILVPDRESLGGFLRHASHFRWNFVGAADHLVSEALYFSDPEGNGIEVYADKPRDRWTWSENHIAMDTLPLDLEAISALAKSGIPKFPEATRLGHMHLTVSDLDASQNFYESLGLKLTANWGHFRFLAWGDYHHHIALNLLSGRNAAAVSSDIAGLHSFSMDRGKLSGPVLDPSGIRLEVQDFNSLDHSV